MTPQPPTPRDYQPHHPQEPHGPLVASTPPQRPRQEPHHHNTTQQQKPVDSKKTHKTTSPPREPRPALNLIHQTPEAIPQTTYQDKYTQEVAEAPTRATITALIEQKLPNLAIARELQLTH